MMRFGPFPVGMAVLVTVALGPLCGVSVGDSEGRVQGGLLSLYVFQSPASGIVPDTAGRSEDSALRIGNPVAVRLLPGALELLPGGTLKSRSRPAKISDMVRIGRELTLEAWVRPSEIDQSGPATILAMSNGTDERNFLLGQEGDRYVARFRTSKTDTEGRPGLSTSSSTAGDDLTHLVFTRDRTGRARIFLNGAQSVEGTIPGGVEDWEKASVTLGYESGVGRHWTGTFYLVAIYGRDLSAHEVARNFRAGYGAVTLSSAGADDGSRRFETEVAPLLARRCLGCHDSVSRNGGLDLSGRSAAFAGGVSGNAINAGSAASSLVWLMAEAESMPKGLAPLSTAEKRLLREWIDDGAPWTLDRLDPAIYAGGDRAMGNWVPRLTVSEYIETVRGSLGVDVSQEAAQMLPADLRADGFKNTAYNLGVDLGHVDAYARLAGIVVDRLDVSEFLDGQEVAEDWMLGLGRTLLRGVLTEHELVLFMKLARSVTEAGGTAEDAAKYVVEAMLQSPRFLYRVELQRGDGTAWPVDPHELASRLSYIVWGAPPDAELLEKARAGSLADEGEVAVQIEQMLADPRAVARSKQFVAQWLDLDRLANLSPSREKFPRWDPALGSDMREETLTFFEDLVWKQGRPLADLLNAQFSYVTPRLAGHYGLPPAGAGMSRFDLSAVPSRGGLLTHGSVLTMGGDDASMVTRGLFVLRDILFSEVGDPPPGLDTSPVPTSPGRSHRAIAMERVESGACGGCHSRFEPLAFGLEKFDGLGAYHEIDEHGNSLREDGEILFPGESEPVAYDSITEMMDRLADSDRVRRNFTRKITQFALGRPLVASDQPAVEEIHRAAQAGGGTYQSAVKAIALSDLVQTTQTEL